MKIKWPHSGNVIIAGFIGMVIFMSCLVFATTFHNPDMVAENYYEKELNFQQNIDAANNAQGMEFPVMFKQDSVFISIPNSLSQTLGSGSIKFYCPSNSKLDKQFPLQQGQNLYAVSTKDWKPMLYLVMINATSNGKSYYKEYPLQINLAKY